jgi:hypothetical protein
MGGSKLKTHNALEGEGERVQVPIPLPVLFTVLYICKKTPTQKFIEERKNKKETKRNGSGKRKEIHPAKITPQDAILSLAFVSPNPTAGL